MGIREYNQSALENNPFTEYQTAIIKLGVSIVFVVACVLARFMMNGPVFDSSWGEFQTTTVFFPVMIITVLFLGAVIISAVLSAYLLYNPTHRLFDEYSDNTKRIIAIRGLFQLVVFVSFIWLIGVWDMLVTIEIAIGMDT